MATWRLQSAKQRFSEVVRAAQAGEPQFITRHGQPVAVVVDIMDYCAALPEGSAAHVHGVPALRSANGRPGVARANP
ncbi:MAG: type II toxin-antitoxin system Phd/YefM family antitoxin [Propionicimonas sp.]